uniref:T9SS C-terminal target domain-containing protein n=1 Tax=candidate division WOR-3 bacterium TaxID=2052148 RepID=A0A7V6CMS9_UNCW3
MRRLIILFCLILFTKSFGWEFRRPLNIPRSFLIAPSVLGKIYAIGGIKINNEITNVVEEYDFLSDTWIIKKPMPQKRYDMGFAVFDNKIYVFGGVSRSSSGRLIVLRDLNVYDPILDTWFFKRPLPSPRAGACGLAINNRIYVFGGYDFSENYLDEVLIYDIERDSWLFYGNMPRPRARMALSYYQPIVHIIGGEFYGPTDKHYCLNLNNNNWDTLSPLPFNRYGFSNSYFDNKIFIFGGEYYCHGQRYFLKRVDIYDCENNNWYLGDSLNIARSHAGGGIITNPYGNFLYILGGNTINGITGSMEIYQLSGIKEKEINKIDKKDNKNILGIYDLLGKRMKENNLKKGIYFYLIKDKNNYYLKKKIVIK